MEGLIPMVYKSLKKSKTRRKYECLSAGAAQTYNIADFYINEHDDYLSTKDHHHYFKAGPADKVSGRHRRYSSVVELRGSGGGGGFAMDADAVKPKQQLVRFRSHRMFSCITGAS